MSKRTVLVVYTNAKSLNTKQIAQLKKYSFNSDTLEVGDVVKSQEYGTNILVVKVLKKAYKYYNRTTGKMSNKFNSTSQWEIRDLIIRDDSETAVYGSLVK